MNPELISYEPCIQQELAKKQAKDKATASMSSVKFMKLSLKQHKVDITKWF